MARSPTKSNGKPRVPKNHILLSREEVVSVLPTLLKMGFGKVALLLWWVTKETGCWKIAATFCEEIAAGNASTGTEREKPVERYEWQRWTKNNFEQIFGLCSKGVTLQDSPKIAHEEYEHYFSTPYDKSNLWNLSDCKDPDLRKIFKFILPLVTPDRGTKKRISLKIAHLVISCWKDKVTVNWCEILHKQFQEMCKKTVGGEISYVTPWLFGIYSHSNELNEAEQGEYHRYLSKYGVGVETPLMTGTQGAMNGGKNAPVDDSGIPSRTNTGVATNVMDEIMNVTATAEMGSDFDRKHSPDADAKAEDVAKTQDEMNGQAEGDEYADVGAAAAVDDFDMSYPDATTDGIMTVTANVEMGSDFEQKHPPDADAKAEDVAKTQDEMNGEAEGDEYADVGAAAAVDDFDMSYPDATTEGIMTVTAANAEMASDFEQKHPPNVFAPWTNEFFDLEKLHDFKTFVDDPSISSNDNPWEPLLRLGRRLSQLFFEEKPTSLIAELRSPGLSAARLLDLFPLFLLKVPDSTQGQYCSTVLYGDSIRGQYDTRRIVEQYCPQEQKRIYRLMEQYCPRLLSRNLLVVLVLRGTSSALWWEIVCRTTKRNDQSAADRRLLQEFFDLPEGVHSNLYSEELQFLKQNRAEIMLLKSLDYDGMISKDVDPSIRQSDTDWGTNNDAPEFRMRPAPLANGAISQNLHDEEAFDYDVSFAQSPCKIARVEERSEHFLLAPGPSGWKDNEQSAGRINRTSLQPAPLADDERSKGPSGEEALRNHSDEGQPLRDNCFRSDMSEEEEALSSFWRHLECSGTTESMGPPSIRSGNRFFDGDSRSLPVIREIRPTASDVDNGCLDPDVSATPSSASPLTHPEISTSLAEVFLDDLDEPLPTAPSPIDAQDHWVSSTSKLSDDMEMKRNECRSLMHFEGEELATVTSKVKATSEGLERSHDKHQATDKYHRLMVLLCTISHMLVGIDAGGKLQGIVEEMKQIFVECFTTSCSLLAHMQTVAAELKQLAEDYEKRGRSFLKVFDSCTLSLCHLVQAFIGKEKSNFLSVATFPNWIAPVA